MGEEVNVSRKRKKLWHLGAAAAAALHGYSKWMILENHRFMIKKLLKKQS